MCCCVLFAATATTARRSSCAIGTKQYQSHADGFLLYAIEATIRVLAIGEDCQNKHDETLEKCYYVARCPFLVLLRGSHAMDPREYQ